MLLKPVYMKRLFLVTIFLANIFLVGVLPASAQVQNKTANIIESGKALVELISIFKKKPALPAYAGNNVKSDSCILKNMADLCFKNSSTKDILVSLYKRNESGYEVSPFTMRVISQKQECWYELRSGIYKYKIETDSAGIKTLSIEGEMKLQACDKMQREITP